MAKRAKKAVQKETAPETTITKRGRPAGKRLASSFARLVAAERKRLQKLRDKIRAQKTRIDRELSDIERDLQGMATFSLSTGQSGRLGSSGRGSSGSSGGRRAGRGQRRQQVLEVIKSGSDGATRGDIIERLNAKGDKALEQS